MADVWTLLSEQIAVMRPVYDDLERRARGVFDGGHMSLWLDEKVGDDLRAAEVVLNNREYDSDAQYHLQHLRIIPMYEIKPHAEAWLTKLSKRRVA